MSFIWVLTYQLITLFIFVVLQILLNLIIGILLMVVWQEMNIYQN